MDKFTEDRFVDDVVKDSIELIIESVEDGIKAAMLSVFEIPYTIDLAMKKMRKIVDLATIKHDGVNVGVAQSFEKLEPDIEPHPVGIDSWARGTVVTRKVIIDENKSHKSVGSDSDPSVSSFCSSVTGKSKTSRMSRVETGKGSRHGDDFDKTGKIIELEDEFEGEFANLLSSTRDFEVLQKMKRSTEKGYTVKDVEKGEFDIIQEKIDKASKELNGKKFVLDRYGNPVVIGKVKAESLPPFSIPLELNIKSVHTHQMAGNNDHGNDNLEEGSEMSESSLSNKKKKKPKIRVTGSRTVEDETFQALNSLATVLSGVETIKLNPGVSIRSNTAHKEGEEIPEEPTKMSKKQFMATKAKALSSSLSPGDSQSVDSKSLGFGAMSGTGSTLIGTSTSPKNKKSLVSSRRSIESMASEGGSVSLTGSLKSLDILPDVDPLEGSRKKKSNAPTRTGDMEDGSELGPTVTMGIPQVGKLPKKQTPQQKANIELLTGNPDNGKPRDRDLPKNVKHVADRKHLPAPPLGHVAGHGLSLEKFLEKSAITEGSEDENDWTQQWRS